MLTATADESKLLYSVLRGVRWEVKVYDKDGAGGVDLTDHQGQDWLKSLTISEDQNNPVVTANVQLRRELLSMSLVPGRTSYANQPSGGGSARDALQLKGIIQISARLVPAGERDAASTRRRLFTGRIDSITVGGGEESIITLECRDLAADLMDWFVLREQGGDLANSTIDVSSETWYKNLTWPRAAQTLLQDLLDGCTAGNVWVVATAVVAGSATVLPTLTRPTVRNGFYYKCTTGGTTHAATEPTWPTTLGATVNDNGVVWRCEGKLPAISTPVSPGWNVNDPDTVVSKTQIVKKAPLLDILRSVAAQIDWELRYRYPDSVDVDPDLTFYDPIQTSLTASFTLSQSFYRIDEMRKDVSGVRNIAVVTYGASAQAKLQKFARDATSESGYFQRRCEFVEGLINNINDATEAQALADDTIVKLKEPWWEGSVNVPLFPHAQLKDVFALDVPNQFFDAAKNFIVMGIQHSFDGTDSRTLWQVRETSGSSVSSAPVSQSIERTAVTGRVRPAVMYLATEFCNVEVYVNSSQIVLEGSKSLVQFDAERIDIGSNWNTGTYVFEAPVNGVYTVQAVVVVRDNGGSGIPAGTMFELILKVGSTYKAKTQQNVSVDSQTVDHLTDLYLGLNAEVYATAEQLLSLYLYHDHGPDVTIQTGSTKSFMTIRRKT